MANALREYMTREGRTNEEVAVDLTALLGKPISPNGVRLHASRQRTPKAWAEALGLHDQPATPSTTDAPPGEEPLSSELRAEDAPPMPPPGAQVAAGPRPGGNFPQGRKRIELAYNAIGAGLSVATQNHSYEIVFSQYAPDLANAWVEAAQTDPRIAKIVAFMESGGPVGQLVVAHIILVGGILYANGKGPDALDAIYGRGLAGARAASHAAAVHREAEARLNGSGSEAPEGFVGEPAI